MEEADILDFGSLNELDFLDEAGLLRGVLTENLDDFYGAECEAFLKVGEESSLAVPATLTREDSSPLGRPVPAARGRCMHMDHAQPCSLCLDAPGSDDWTSYELCGDKGKKNGAKLLRSLLKKTPQWADASKREDAIRAANTAGHDRLVAALVDGHVARLRKEEILFIAHHWSLRSSIWKHRAPAPAPAVPSACEARTQPAGASSKLRRQRSNDSASVETVHLSDCDQDDLPELEPAAPTACAFGRGDAPIDVESALFVMAVKQNILPALMSVIDQASDTVMARPTRDMCFALNGSGITEAKVAEMHETRRRISSASQAIDPLQMASIVRLMRIKEHEKSEAPASGRLLAEQAIQQEDLLFEVALRSILPQKQLDIAAMQANLIARPGLNALDLLDRVSLSAWTEGAEIIKTILDVLERARTNNSVKTYLEVSCILQEAFKTHRINSEAAFLYQIAWVEEVVEHAKALIQPVAHYVPHLDQSASFDRGDLGGAQLFSMMEYWAELESAAAVLTSSTAGSKRKRADEPACSRAAKREPSEAPVLRGVLHC